MPMFSLHLLWSLVLDQLEHVLDELLQLPLSDVPVAVHVKHTENPSQSLLSSAVGHDVEDQLKFMENQGFLIRSNSEEGN